MLPGQVQSIFALVLVLPYTIADYAQNIAVARLLSDFLSANPDSLSFASALIVTKFALSRHPGDRHRAFRAGGPETPGLMPNRAGELHEPDHDLLADAGACAADLHRLRRAGPAPVRRGQVGEAKVGQYKVRSTEPASSVTVAANLINQFELPVLFYVLCLTLHVTNGVNYLTLALMWIFVAVALCPRLGAPDQQQSAAAQPLFLRRRGGSRCSAWIWFALHLLASGVSRAIAGFVQQRAKVDASRVNGSKDRTPRSCACRT